MTEINGQTSDGYHTFDELYIHRRALTAALFKLAAIKAWRSRAHHPDDDQIFDGYFIVGLDLPQGTVTYHYADQYWDDFRAIKELDHAPKWDGALPELSVTRLIMFATGNAS